MLDNYSLLAVPQSISNMERVAIAELLDTDAGTANEIASSLRDLRHINQWFGGIGTTQSLIEQVAEKAQARSLSMLEVASGTGFVPNAVQERLGRSGIQLNLTLMDRAASHLNDGNGRGVRQISGDARALPFCANSFDVVSSCIFLHHLSPEEVVESIKESLRVCRLAVLINDVVRHPLHLALVYAGLPLFRSRLTWHDAPASVRQAYTTQEMRQLLQQTSAREIVIQRHYLFRMGIIVWK